MPKRVIVLGDAMVDWHWLLDEREEGHFVLVREERILGGAAHVAAILRELGLRVHLHCALAQDDAGTWLWTRCQDLGIEITSLPLRRTLQRIYAAGGAGWRCDMNETVATSHCWPDLSACEAVVIADHGYGAVPDVRVPCPARCFVDGTPKRPLELYQTWRAEYFQGNQAAWDAWSQGRARLRAWRQARATCVCETRAERGSVITVGAHQWRQPGVAPTEDAVGAGDHYLAAIVWARLAGHTWGMATAYAARYAAAACSLRGAAVAPSAALQQPIPA